MNKLQLIYLLIPFYLFGFNSLVDAQGIWEQKKEKNGIKVFTRNMDNSDFKAFKGETILHASVNSFVAVLSDIENMHEWTYKVKDANLLEQSGDSLQLYYAEASVPFPYDNRDGIYQNRFNWDADSNILFLEVTLLHDYLEEKKDLVRTKGNGFWKVVVPGPDKLEITFQMQIDPGGNLPAWLVNAFVDDTPYQTLKELKEMIQKEKYQNQQFDFLGD